MRILIKFPTRSRPQKAYATLEKYVKLANDPTRIGILVSCDDDDATMTNVDIRQKFETLGKRVEWFQMDFSSNKTKIEACNSGMDRISYSWDIVLLASDDMIPQEQGYDSKIRLHMRTSFPDTNGILWFNDGLQQHNLNTLSIMGRRMYESFGYIYHPAYKSFFCDTEFTDLCRGRLRDKCLYLSQCIIRHEHPISGMIVADQLYMNNNRYWQEDMRTYMERKEYPIDWSILIPTIPGRETSLATLQTSIREKIARICPDLRYEICIEFDRKILSIGAKRQRLLNRAQGRYMSFIDDDDNITDAYIEDIRDCIRGNYDVMQLRGTLGGYKFMHSLCVRHTDPMSDGTQFLRPPNHLNPMRSYFAKQISFENKQYYEDLDWSIRLSSSGILTKEYTTDPSRIHYLYTIGSHMIINEGTLRSQMKLTSEQMLKQMTTTRQATPTLRLGPRGFVSR